MWYTLSYVSACGGSCGAAAAVKRAARGEEQAHHSHNCQWCVPTWPRKELDDIHHAQYAFADPLSQTRLLPRYFSRVLVLLADEVRVFVTKTLVQFQCRTAKSNLRTQRKSSPARMCSRCSCQSGVEGNGIGSEAMHIQQP